MNFIPAMAPRCEIETKIEKIIVKPPSYPRAGEICGMQIMRKLELNTYKPMATANNGLGLNKREPDNKTVELELIIIIIYKRGRVEVRKLL